MRLRFLLNNLCIYIIRTLCCFRPRKNQMLIDSKIQVLVSYIKTRILFKIETELQIWAKDTHNSDRNMFFLEKF